MKTITNISSVTDYSTDPPEIVYSNPVTTVIRQPAPPVIITRFFYNTDNCNCCCCCDCWDCF